MSDPAAKVFLTGGSGFVGRGVLGALVSEGREVVALASGMTGCEVVYHVAGMNAFCLADPSPLFRVNVDGSLAVVRAAARAGVRRIVYTSSASTLGEAAG